MNTNAQYFNVSYDGNDFRYNYDTEIVELMQNGKTFCQTSMSRSDWRDEYSRKQFLSDWVSLLFLQVMAINNI